MNLPSNLLPLVDGDWIVHMACSAVEYPLLKEWRDNGEVGEQPIASFDETISALNYKLAEIVRVLDTYEKPFFFFSGANNFRKDIAITKPYKGNRTHEKPHHYNNLQLYIEANYITVLDDNLEADDTMAIWQTESEEYYTEPIHTTCIVTVDKDLRQVNGWHYSPEGANFPSFGPTYVTDENSYIELNNKRNKIIGTGWKFFYSQLLTGDDVDNIPGCPGVGPVKAHTLLANTTTKGEAYKVVRNAYRGTVLMADECLLEQAQLLYMIRRVDDDGQPEMWTPPTMGETNGTT